jgi:hypothetical protein
MKKVSQINPHERSSRKKERESHHPFAYRGGMLLKPQRGENNKFHLKMFFLSLFARILFFTPRLVFITLAPHNNET